MTMTQLAKLRKDYTRATLSETDVDPNPLRQFEHWFEQALLAQVPEPNTMTLATVGPDNRPSARIMLLKGVSDAGFTFFTNYLSRKGRNLANHPYACLQFYWIELERQVRIEGIVHKISEADSDAYFASRPLGSQLAACASEQSEQIASRAALDARFAACEARFAARKDHTDNAPPRPPHWGGYRLAPDAIEFWQGRPSRLHDRIKYLLGPDNSWRIVRLAP